MLVLDNIEVGYTFTPVLNNVSTRIKKGEFVGVIGPNGSGKSTLLRVISRILVPWKGKVLLKNRDICSFKRRGLARIISMVPQTSSFAFPFSCYEIVLMGRFPYSSWITSKEDYEVVDWAMHLTDTYHLKDRTIDETSGGERQRVRIARAIAQRPEIFLLDEPTTYLDINHEVEIFGLLSKLNREGITIIAVSHDLNIASDYSKRILLMKEGRIIEEGSPHQIFRENIVKEVYGQRVRVIENPVTGMPHIIPIKN